MSDCVPLRDTVHVYDVFIHKQNESELGYVTVTVLCSQLNIPVSLAALTPPPSLAADHLSLFELPPTSTGSLSLCQWCDAVVRRRYCRGILCSGCACDIVFLVSYAFVVAYLQRGRKWEQKQ